MEYTYNPVKQDQNHNKFQWVIAFTEMCHPLTTWSITQLCQRQLLCLTWDSHIIPGATSLKPFTFTFSAQGFLTFYFK